MLTNIILSKDVCYATILYFISLGLLIASFIFNMDIFVYCLIAFLVVSILLSKRERALLLIMMAVSMGDMITVSPRYTTSLFGIVLVAFIIKNLRYVHIMNHSFLLYIFLTVYMIAGMRLGQESFFSDIQTIVNYFVLYIIIEQFDFVNVRQYFKAFIAGHFWATVSSVLIISTYRYSMIVEDDSVKLMHQATKRFSGMQMDPNFFALFCLLVITLIIFSLANDDTIMNRHISKILLIIYFFFGVFSLSKMFVAAIIALVLYFYLSKNEVPLWKKIGSIILLGCLYLFLDACFEGKLFEALFGRFINLNKNYGAIINALTTGRITIWKAYIYDWISSAKKIFLGVGLAQKKLKYVGKSHHQLFIELLYQFGIVGSTIYVMYLASLYKLLKGNIAFNNKNIGKRLGYMGVFLIILCGFSLGLFAFNVSVYLYFFALIMLVVTKSGNKNINGQLQ